MRKASLCTYMIIIFQRKYLGKSMLIMMMSTLLALLAWTFKIPLHHMWVVPTLESVQDFLIKLDMKPCVHLVEISIFSLNHVIIRLTQIMNNFLKHLKIRTFKVIFLCQKLVESFPKTFSMKNIWLEDQLLVKNVFENFDF